jgi:hypothetical protein
MIIYHAIRLLWWMGGWVHGLIAEWVGVGRGGIEAISYLLVYLAMCVLCRPGFVLYHLVRIIIIITISISINIITIINITMTTIPTIAIKRNLS